MGVTLSTDASFSPKDGGGPSSGATEAMSEPVSRLPSKPASARFDASVTPPCFTAIT
jgi:hypothetical protein